MNKLYYINRYNALIICLQVDAVKSSGLTQEQLTIVNGLRPQVEQMAGKEFAHYYPVGIKSQVVAGTNFFVKIQVTETEYIHVKIFRPLPHSDEEI